MATYLVIVESPSKARTIARFLGPEYVIESSIGHIRDLPSDASEIPSKYKDQPWSRLGVDIEHGFQPLYVIPKSKKDQVAKLRARMKDASALYLATDEDREGEAIAWHLVDVLKPKVPVKRMVFHEITAEAIESALDGTRSVNDALVKAQEARRILDRLVGYEVSPVLWRKVRPKLSAGRVQSVATRLIVARERQRMAFTEAEYWGIEAHLSTAESAHFTARLTELGGRRIATGKDFDATSGELKDSRCRWLIGDTAKALAQEIESRQLTVAEVTEKHFTERPYPPFITSTLQQEAGRKLRFNAQRTMRVAQSLYEAGHITYMRTDSTNLSQQAISAARQQAVQLYGASYVPEKPRYYQTKAKAAQEAHEAIRPAGETFQRPQQLAGKVTSDELKLYELIWKRTLACQMKNAEGRRTTVKITTETADDGTAVFTTSGKVFTFVGFLRAYVEGSDEPTAELADQEKVLPAMQRSDELVTRTLETTRHTTQPTARYTEASLVKELENLGIGRPSTYATIIQTIQDRGYVWKKSGALVPTFTAFAVTNLLEGYLPDLVDYDFTARMETELDTIASGQREPEPWLEEFYFGRSNGGTNGFTVMQVGLKNLIETSTDVIDPREVSRITIGVTEEGDEIVVRVGRYGPYVQIGESDQRASVPADIVPDELTVRRALELVEQSAKQDRKLGDDPNTGKPVYLKVGRFGPYVQLGDPELTEKGNVKRGSKPKMASLWPSMTPDGITLEDAVMLLSFPRTVGTHPETGEEITAQDGRFGPYLKMGSDTRSLANHEELANIDLSGAVQLFKQPKQRRQARAAVLADLGAHPSRGDQIQIKNGRFGPYVTDGTVNASVPKGTDPEAVTLERAIELLEAREEKLKAQGKDPRAPKKTRSRTAGRKGSKQKSTAKRKSTAKS